MAVPLKEEKAVLSWHRGRDGLVLGMGFCRAYAVVMVPVAWGAMMGWVGWHRYSGVGGDGLSAIISGRAIQELRGRKRGRWESGKENVAKHDVYAPKVEQEMVEKVTATE